MIRCLFLACCLLCYALSWTDAEFGVYPLLVANALAPSSRRRRFLAGSFGAFTLPTISCPNENNDRAAVAAPPISAKETDSVLAIAKRKLRKKPPKTLRRKLSQDFAVLLMRSSYNALDDLNCVGMDQFQRDFFLLRSSEYEAYTQALGDGLVQQGDLTDPYYFDFISFAQYKTINRELTKDPLMVFEEMQLAPEDDKRMDDSSSSNNNNGVAGRFIPVVVQRDPKMSNGLLVPTHSSKVGAVVLDRLIETFSDSDSRIPNLDAILRPGEEKYPSLLYAALQQLVNLFLISGYAFGGDVAMVANDSGNARGTKFKISLNAPATLWGGQVLQQEGAALSNNFLLKCVTELLARAGYDSTSTTKYEGTTEVITVTVV